MVRGRRIKKGVDIAVCSLSRMWRPLRRVLLGAKPPADRFSGKDFPATVPHEWEESHLLLDLYDDTEAFFHPFDEYGAFHGDRGRRDGSSR
ncbi:hypothetical protein ELG72_37695 [Rhizobium leguminosarum]|uniref:hypothetical protein n=1 Tax=Rhizobium TaxID=379 RepID=UPI00102FF80B|nr:hypothetical protein [Rhizobium leguminosarum]TBF87878.1 hypothetical protein ELG82_37405 [Rhizobium leguminosarum]TBG07141.1 hypothetical protein ELG80_37290 [Rhizobium leguminosarum]TBG07705.1 hypothetical protein ELG81_37595 [Rhizobium leguminosarum]TBG30825.1 hypothetical protein ELG75_36990 [Rhizobium leguminosarum]TBG50071.1 hypothetical protein ELG72_37695 [Rhizobium leguminosarum]